MIFHLIYYNETRSNFPFKIKEYRFRPTLLKELLEFYLGDSRMVYIRDIDKLSDVVYRLLGIS